MIRKPLRARSANLISFLIFLLISFTSSLAPASRDSRRRSISSWRCGKCLLSSVFLHLTLAVTWQTAAALRTARSMHWHLSCGLKTSLLCSSSSASSWESNSAWYDLRSAGRHPRACCDGRWLLCFVSSRRLLCSGRLKVIRTVR